MGFEDEEEQSYSRPCHQSDGRRKRTCELTSSIVPRGTSSTVRWSSSFLLLPIGGSCRCGFPGPAELGAVNPDAVHDHGEPTGQRHDCLFLPAAPGDLHRPSLEP